MDRELGEIDQKAASSSASDNSRNSETVIAINGANALVDSNVKSNGSSAEKLEGGDKCSSFSIDVNDFSGENQRVCRICHLSAKEIGKSSDELLELGCGCKGELGVAHSPCAEAWFRVKGNRFCEICGETAKNIKGISVNGFMEEWNEGSGDSISANTSDGRRRYLRGQPLCNFLMACLVIAFVLPWFFRVNMF